MGLYRSRPMPFGQRLAASIRQRPLAVSTLNVPKHANVYTCGERDGKVYLIENGPIKTLVLSPDGKQCLLSIFTTNDIFGELCLAGGERVETATAMEDSVLKQMACADFLALVTREGLGEDFIKHLAMRLASQQRLIANLATVDSEHRLAATLLQLALRLGKQVPCSCSWRLEQKISHQELAEMVGTTRPRICEFMGRFRDLGLIETTPEGFLIVKEQQLAEYPGASVQAHGNNRSQNNSFKLSNIGQTTLR
jgi:CRP/FNR family transcriptional regulator, cyclic AMP receptor protein